MSSSASAAAPAAVYDRVIAASLERIWENVLDWEHLPYLHSQSFSHVQPIRVGHDGWRGHLTLVGGIATEIEVTLDRERLRYVTANVGGFGEGSRIVTTLSPQSDGATAIHVEFHLPWAPPDAAEKIGSAYRATYEVLWDQDEAMMVRRQQVLDRAPAGSDHERVALGDTAAVRSRLPLEVDFGTGRCVVFEARSEMVAADLLCPHLGGPLRMDGDGTLVCPWHGYRFDAREGRSCDGRGLRLRRAPGVEIGGDGTVALVAERSRT